MMALEAKYKKDPKSITKQENQCYDVLKTIRKLKVERANKNYECEKYRLKLK